MKKREMPAGISRFVFATFLLTASVFASCASKPRIAEFTLQNGVQQYFVHQITIKKSKFIVQFDATIHVRDSKLTDNPVVRYMLYDQIFGQEPQNVVMSFECGGKEYACSKAKLLYKDVELNGQRFEMEMQPVDFTELTYKPDTIFLLFKNSKTGEYLGKVETKAFRDSLVKLRYVISNNEDAEDVDVSNLSDVIRAVATVESNE